MKSNRKFNTPAGVMPGRFTVPEKTDRGSDSLRPVFSFEYLADKQWRNMQKDEKSALADKLFKVSKSSCLELRQMGRDPGSEYVPIDQLNITLPERFKNSPGIVVFHMAGNVAIVCVKEGNTHYILDVDRNFKAYNHG